MDHTFRRDSGAAVAETALGRVRGYAHDGLLVF